MDKGLAGRYCPFFPVNCPFFPVNCLFFPVPSTVSPGFLRDMYRMIQAVQ